MTPDTGRIEPTLRHDPRSRAKSGSGSAAAGTSSPLSALSEASRKYARLSAAETPPRPRFSRALPFAAALIVGMAIFFAGRFEYRCAATVRINGPLAEERTDSCRKELLDFAWVNLKPGESEASTPAWLVDVPEPATLRLILTTPNRPGGLEAVQMAAGGYITQVHDRWQAARSTPTPSEQILARRTDELQTRLQDTETQIETIRSASPSGDPAAVRSMLREQWQELRKRFADVRRNLTEADDEVARLEAEPVPAHGIIDSTERREAMEEDLALQQDLGELQVNLLELRNQLLGVWRKSSAELEQLTTAGEELSGTLAYHQDASFSESGRMPVAELAESAGKYIASLQTFAEAWTKDQENLEQLPEAGLAEELLELHNHGRTVLNDFLFTADKELGEMREIAQNLGDIPGDHARFHVLLSDVTRAFQKLQSAHHRFGFAAASIESRENFRLDAALQAARGLRRRTREQIAAIEEVLQKQAVESARQDHADALERAATEVEKHREQAEGIVGELVDLQESLNATLDESDQFLRATLQAEWVESQQELTAADLKRLQEQLDTIAAERAAAWDGISLELVDVQVLGRPVNLNHRLRIGGLAALCTLLTVGLGQWWLGRRG